MTVPPTPAPAITTPAVVAVFIENTAPSPPAPAPRALSARVFPTFVPVESLGAGIKNPCSAWLKVVLERDAQRLSSWPFGIVTLQVWPEGVRTVVGAAGGKRREIAWSETSRGPSDDIWFAPFSTGCSFHFEPLQIVNSVLIKHLFKAHFHLCGENFDQVNYKSMSQKPRDTHYY